MELAEYKDRLSSFKPIGGSAKWQDFIMKHQHSVRRDLRATVR